MLVTERAVSERSGVVTWLLVDRDGLVAHPEARLFAVHLSAKSTATQRAYVPRVGRFLNWCETVGVDWRRANLGDLTRFKVHVESAVTQRQVVPSGKTVNATLPAVSEFLRFCAAHGLIDPQVVDFLSQPRRLTFAPRGFHPGEAGQFLTVRARTLKAAEIELPPATITQAQESAVLAACLSARDRFLVVLLVDSGLRIGEALGLRREDLHLLPDSLVLGCATKGAHVHVRPRLNVNEARAKGGRPRTVPVSRRCAGLYSDYLFERDRVRAASGCDFVFVNLVGASAGSPMRYSNAKQILERVGDRVGTRVRPHMFRHTAATRWIRAGVATDVVQLLLGHASSASTAVYVHASDEDLRAAVDLVEHGRPLIISAAQGGQW